MNTLTNCISKAGKLLSPREGQNLIEMAGTMGDEGAVAAAIAEIDGDLVSIIQQTDSADAYTAALQPQPEAVPAPTPAPVEQPIVRPPNAQETLQFKRLADRLRAQGFNIKILKGEIGQYRNNAIRLTLVDVVKHRVYAGTITRT
jgi:hypothetical protein